MVTKGVRVKTAPFHVIQLFHLSKRGTSVGCQIEVGNPESVQEIFFLARDEVIALQ